MAKKNNLLWYAGAAVSAYIIIKPSSPGANPISALTTAASNLISTTSLPAAANSYPYLTAGAPPIPQAFDQTFYSTYIRPAMVQANPNVNNSAYTLSDSESTDYLNNYLDLRQGLPNWIGSKFATGGTPQTLNQAAQRHWHIYGVPEQRTFLPLPWSKMVQYVPPPVNPKSSGGSGIFGTLLKVATIAGGAAITIASGGTLAPIVAPATSAALAAESSIHGTPDDLTAGEVSIIVTSAAIIKKILPFYLQVNPTLVTSIENKLDSLIVQYAN